ncbi:hypothetical protein [Curtobacterium sp. ISL-83]|uniref:hypothetical protein n=1 Tax=Curtobacterium sp. ISL-83 TaxID=2819145 RepID=UPI001BEAE646|nr:hypothetical protein [Curtobacterium sp. ISL-83]MBT2502422.1 hypothetical protein [Curtobacterium sp. ISL-83]
MFGGRLMIATASAVAVLLAIAVTVVAAPTTPLREGTISGGACSSFATADPDETVTVTIVLHNTSQDAVRILGAQAFRPIGTGGVQLRAVPGHDLHANSFGDLDAFAAAEHVVAARGAVLPAERASTLLATFRRGSGTGTAMIGGVVLAYPGPLGTIRQTTLRAPLGITAPDAPDSCDLDAVTTDD